MLRYCKIKNCIIGLDRPKICVPLVGRTEEEILAQTEEIAEISKNSTIDMVEFRGDFYEDLSDTEKLSETMKKLGSLIPDKVLLFTIRSEQEGGERLKKDSKSIARLNRFVVEQQLADMIDIELFSGVDEAKELIELAHSYNRKVIVSNHDFKTTPDANVIVNRLRSMQDLGADIAKIAVMPENKMQVVNLIAATTMMSELYAQIPIVTMSMGKLGAISRIGGNLFGSAVTFASLSQVSAPGQIPVSDLNTILDLCRRYCE